jgi:hypothetical protein
MMAAAMMAATIRPTPSATIIDLTSRLWRYGCHRGNNHFPRRLIIIFVLIPDFRLCFHQDFSSDFAPKQTNILKWQLA